MLRASQLTKTFHSEAGPRRALDGVDFELAGGEVLCLLGENGSGKTTLLKTLCGLVLPDSGRAQVAGFDLEASPDEARRRTGFSPGEERSFYGRLSALENLRFFARLRGLDEGALRRRLDALEEPLGLAVLLGLPAQKLSAGMKQRLSLARALLHEPQVLLLDEPTKSLDPAAAERLRGLVAEQYRGRSDRLVVWSTHDLAEARQTGTLTAVLSAGRLEFNAPCP